MNIIGQNLTDVILMSALNRDKLKGRFSKNGGLFGSRPIFRAGKTPKIPSLGLSLLPNPTETLAMSLRGLIVFVKTL